MCEVEKDDVKEKTVRPPKLYDLTTLQREANRMFGYTAQQTLDAVKALGCKTGLTIKPGTAPEALAPYLDQLDLVLVMSVEPGFGGQKFMPSALDKLRWLKAEREKRGLHYLLEVDGGVDDTTAPLCVEAGADVLVAGSAVFGKDDRTAAVRRLAAL